MSERIAMRRYSESKSSPLAIDVSSLVGPFIVMLDRILVMQDWFDRLNRNKILSQSIQDIAWIKNKTLYIMELYKHWDDQKLFLKSLLDSKLPLVWESVFNIIEKQLSSNQIWVLNKKLSIKINPFERSLSLESRQLILEALEQKIWNRPDFVGPPKPMI